MQADCTFCQIVSGELPADYVDEDEHTVAFMDINPATRGHLLVVSRTHVPDVMSASEEEWVAVAATARRMARLATGAFKAGGVDLVQANSDGMAGAQTIFHLHVHVVPRYHDDRLGQWWRQETADPSEVTESARMLVEFARRDPDRERERPPAWA
jgi:histidine triad (HIT) family protein